MQLCMKNVLMNAVMIVMIRLPIFSALGFLSNRISNTILLVYPRYYFVTQKSQKSQKTCLAVWVYVIIKYNYYDRQRNYLPN